MIILNDSIDERSRIMLSMRVYEVLTNYGKPNTKMSTKRYFNRIKWLAEILLVF